LVKTLTRKIPSATETLGLWRLHQSILGKDDISGERSVCDYAERSG